MSVASVMYRRAVLARFADGAVPHRTAQIAQDGSQKLPVRILPTLRARLAAGHEAPHLERVVALWLCQVHAGCVAAAPLVDPLVDTFRETAQRSPTLTAFAAATLARATVFGADLAADVAFHARTLGVVDAIGRTGAARTLECAYPGV